ncbi:helix-turn-helix domain-containing protein [Marinimicrobium sp. ABcell2]|uniref:helix-turn-helix domain-containing protein n=1 Tax=Marinimicrobium sp. ABcell2 TaxID=3069751 RepID=UPI00359C4659
MDTIATMQRSRTLAIDNLTDVTRVKMNHLGGRLRAARQRRGWSYERCAEFAKVSTTTIKGIERGDPAIGFGFYVAVLQAFGMVTELDGLCLICKDHFLGPGAAESGITKKVTFDDDL